MQTPEVPIEHHPSCKERCVPGCRVSPGRAVDVLSVNYRLSVREAYALGLFDDQFETAFAVLRAAVDWPTFVEWNSKKKAGEPSGK